jgi:hypothetical protein
MPHASHAASDAGLTAARALIFAGIAIIAISIVGALRILFGLLSLSPIIALLAVVFLFLAMAGMYPIMFGAFRLLAEKRVRAVAAQHPDAFVLHIVLRPSIARQVRAAAAALGVAARGVPSNNYAVLVADRQSISIYGGAGTLRTALPVAALTRVNYQPVTIGVRTLTEFILEFTDQTGQRWPVELLPVRWPGVFMRSLPHEDFAAQLAAMQAATHPGS